jgi:hypothetical protein
VQVQAWLAAEEFWGTGLKLHIVEGARLGSWRIGVVSHTMESTSESTTGSARFKFFLERTGMRRRGEVPKVGDRNVQLSQGVESDRFGGASLKFHIIKRAFLRSCTTGTTPSPTATTTTATTTGSASLDTMTIYRPRILFDLKTRAANKIGDI